MFIINLRCRLKVSATPEDVGPAAEGVRRFGANAVQLLLDRRINQELSSAGVQEMKRGEQVLGSIAY
jgi:hypothetical protein